VEYWTEMKRVKSLTRTWYVFQYTSARHEAY
jgi:hypothetical protein